MICLEKEGDRGEGRAGLSISFPTIPSRCTPDILCLTQEVRPNSTRGPVPEKDPGRS